MQQIRNDTRPEESIIRERVMVFFDKFLPQLNSDEEFTVINRDDDLHVRDLIVSLAPYMSIMSYIKL
jgi:hypothetical protein